MIEGAQNKEVFSNDEPLDLLKQIGPTLVIPTCKIAGEYLLEGGSGLQTGSPLFCEIKTAFWVFRPKT